MTLDLVGTRQQLLRAEQQIHRSTDDGHAPQGIRPIVRDMCTLPLEVWIIKSPEAFIRWRERHRGNSVQQRFALSGALS